MSIRNLHTSSGSLSDMSAINMNTTSTKSNNTQSPCNSLRSTTSTLSVAVTPASDGCVSSITAIDLPNNFGSIRRKSVFFSIEQEHDHAYGESSRIGRTDSDSVRTADSTDTSTPAKASTDNTYTARNSSVDVSAAVVQPSLGITGSYNPQHMHIRSSSSTLPR
jgi:hypothetical protein